MSLEHVQGGTWFVRAGDLDYYFKCRAGPHRLPLEADLARHLAEHGIAAEEPVPTRTGALWVGDGPSYCLYRALPGRPLALDQVAAGGRTPDSLNAQALGAGLARVHRGLSGFAPTTGAGVAPMSLANPTSQGFGAASRQPTAAESVLLARLAGWEGRLRSWIHRDPHPGNLLFTEGQLTGVIDLDHAVLGWPEFDVAYLLAGLAIGWSPMGPASALAEPMVKEAFLWTAGEIATGYRRERPDPPLAWQDIWLHAWAVEWLFAGYLAEDPMGQAASVELADWFLSTGALLTAAIEGATG